MKRFAYAMCLGFCVVGFAGLAGCDRDVSHTREVKVDDDKVKTKDTTITESPSGITVEKKTTTKDYDDGKVKTETETKTYPKP